MEAADIAKCEEVFDSSKEHFDNGAMIYFLVLGLVIPLCLGCIIQSKIANKLADPGSTLEALEGGVRRLSCQIADGLHHAAEKYSPGMLSPTYLSTENMASAGMSAAQREAVIGGKTTGYEESDIEFVRV